MEILIESMTKMVHRNKKMPFKMHTIRAWRQEETWSADSSTACTIDCLAALAEIEPEATQYEIAKKLLGLERMNAIEVLDELGNGPVIYKDWP